jgi:large subunit ribosomal protein L10
MHVDEKRKVVEKLAARMRDSQSMIVADYRGLSVTQLANLRNALRETGASFHVAKNTLARIAATEADQPLLAEMLAGPTAIAFVGDDPAAAAKKLSEAARQTRILQVRGAVLDGKALSGDDVRRLGDLPPKDVLQAQVVGAIAAPLQGAHAVISAPVREFVIVLDQYIAQRQAAEAA